MRGNYAYSLTVSAGDLISASQLASSIHLDEPAIGVANRIGLDFNAVGNHEFDRGQQELLRMQNGGCEQFTSRKPCAVERFKGASFKFLAASTIRSDGKTLFPRYMIRTFGTGKRQVKVAVIGLTLKDTPTLVSPGGIKGLRFADEADTINALVPVLKAKGADAIVVLIHQGGQQDGAPDPGACANFSGEIRPILDRLDARVDLVVSGHTHRAYICDYAQYISHADSHHEVISLKNKIDRWNILFWKTIETPNRRSEVLIQQKRQTLWNFDPLSNLGFLIGPAK